MTDAQQREAARQFFYRWNGKGREDEDARSYWIEILTNILGFDRVTERVDFEKKVVGADGNTKRIDVYIPETHVLIEQKSLGIALDKPQAGHNGMTPYEQAKYYDNYLPFSERARWIITSNFEEIWIYDRDAVKPDPVKITLTDLPAKYHMLDFLVNTEVKKVTDEMKISLQAGELVGRLYDAFLKQYRDPENEETLKSLNKLCVRIVFCLYAEDASVFGRKSMFHDYMQQFDAAHARKGLRDLFRVLNQKPEDRDPYLADDDPMLAAFPYVNGGLFDGDDIEIPPFTDEIMDLLLRKASDDFDWSEISPTIFGAVFESTLNPETRRSGGMHYTSIENIHKVIDPLFLDDLKAEFEDIKNISVLRTREKKLHALQDKLASLSFLDPSAGSGNFLTESYLQLRKLENQILRLLTHGQITFGYEGFSPIKVSISQFYGIEINDFAVTVARTALWIAENQMLKETEDIVHMQLDFLPLKTNAYIVEGNALRIDWNDVVPKDKLNYIMGNPPFSGGMYMGASQKNEIREIFSEVKGAGELDYVCAWYQRAAEYTLGTKIHSAFVSTNSICQGEQVITFWKYMKQKYPITFNFAYSTFVWDSEAATKAKVHCVIIGFSLYDDKKDKHVIDEGGGITVCKHINPYLADAEDFFIESRSTPLFDVPKMRFGSMPRDGGGFVLTEDEAAELAANEPLSRNWIRPYIGATEFINNKSRYCLWMVNANPDDLKKCPEVMKRINSVRDFRASSKAAGTRKFAETPTVFCQIAQPDTDYIIVPKTSSGRRRYLPIGFMDKNTIASDLVFLIPDADLYHFGILMSNVHNAWMRTVAGRLKSDYRYSKDIVYNNFPWPDVTSQQKDMIEKTAKIIIDVRNSFSGSSLAGLYDPNTMPPTLRKAHQANDRAVMQAYGMPIKETDEAACVAWLMKLYQEKVNEAR
ncbi:MAG: class I SAM-dependent DNA methyltransferase [Lachnospiraceae bacterium]|nr:class I SAM-dependent DNA methyltransferase [Lachnospiraceae bacterium]